MKSIGGINVMDITGCLLKMAESLGDLKKMGILVRPRRGYAPTVSKEELLGLTDSFRSVAQGIPSD